MGPCSNPFSFVSGLCICAIHVLIKTKFAYLPESVAVVVLGAMLGGLIKLLQKYDLGNWEVGLFPSREIVGLALVFNLKLCSRSTFNK